MQEPELSGTLVEYEDDDPFRFDQYKAQTAHTANIELPCAEDSSFEKTWKQPLLSPYKMSTERLKDSSEGEWDIQTPNYI